MKDSKAHKIKLEYTEGRDGLQIPVYAAHDIIQDISMIEPNPRNPNKHPDKQLRLLAKIIAQQGWRTAITVSTRSGYIVRGHARLEAAKLLGLDTAPVDLQDYASEEDELADLVADNRIAELAEMDGGDLKDLLQQLDTGAFDMELTGYTTTDLEQLLTQHHVEADEAEPEAQTLICFSFNDEEADIVQKALAVAKEKYGDMTDDRALYKIVCDWLEA